MMRLGQGTQLLLYAVHSDSDIAVVGGTSVIGKGNIFDGRLIQALGSSEGFYHSLTIGVDWKDFLEDVKHGADRNSNPRSEERRVGDDGVRNVRSWWYPSHYKKTID